jgi:hypothetical protein
MLVCHHKPEENLVITHVSGKVKFKDHPSLAKIIKTKIAEHGKVRWLWIGEHFTGWSLKYFVWNGVFDLWHTFHFEKIAIVGNQKSIRWMAKIITPFTPAQVKYFQLEDKNLSEEWIRN